MPYPTHLLPTTVVGSYPQPAWLVDGDILKQHGVPRVHAHGIWRIDDTILEQAQDDGTILAIREMERAGIDIVTDGEIRRESYSNRFALALDGIDADQPGEVRSQAGRATPVPRVVGKIKRRGPVEVRDTEFLLSNATKATKITLPGPFTHDAAGTQLFLSRTRPNWRWITLSPSMRNCGRSKACGVDDGAARRAVGAHIAGEKRRATGFVPSIAHSRELKVPRLFIFVSDTRQWSPTNRPAIAFYRNWRIQPRSKSRSRRPNRSWISVSYATSPAKRSCLALSIWGIPRSSQPKRSRTEFARH